MLNNEILEATGHTNWVELYDECIRRIPRFEILPSNTTLRHELKSEICSMGKSLHRIQLTKYDLMERVANEFMELRFNKTDYRMINDLYNEVMGTIHTTNMAFERKLMIDKVMKLAELLKP